MFVGGPLLVLLCTCVAVISGQSVWSDDYTSDISANPNINPAYTVNTRWDSATSYVPSVDPQSANHALQNVYGLWHFNSVIGTTVQDTSIYLPNNGTISGAVTFTASGKYNGALSFAGNTVNDKVVITTSPLTNQMARGAGFSASLWFKYAGSSAPAATSVLFEIQYGAFALSYTTTGFQCGVRSTTNLFFYASVPYPSGSIGQWTHLACSYSPVTYNLTMVVNGVNTKTVFANLTDGIFFGDHAPMGIGNSPYTTTQLSVKGIIDDFVFYSSAISVADALYLANAGSELVPLPAPTFRSSLISHTVTPDYWDFTPTWKASNTSAIQVEFSTNRGATWCKVQFNVAVGLNQLCYLPASTMIYRVTFLSQASIDSISFSFKDTEPTRNWGTSVKVGINRGSYFYNSNSWLFVDAMKSAQTPAPNFVFDSNFYPTNANASNRFLFLLAATPTIAPTPANYTVFADGEGIIGCQNSADASGKPPGGYYNYMATVPSGLPIHCFNPWQGFITSSNPANPIRNLSFVLNGFESTYTTAPFHPRYLSTFSGVANQRFMDMGKTNGNNMIHWSDRTLKTSITQDLTVRTAVINIASITDAGTTPSNFSGDWKVLVTTTTAHPFGTGQVVTIAGTNAFVSWTLNAAVQTPIPINGTWTIEVLSSTTFYVVYSDAHSGSFSARSAGQNTATITPGTFGSVYATVSSGIALEYLTQLAATMKSDGWFCVPTLVEDDYILKLAQLLYANMPADKKAYIEFGNELWNTAFSQALFAQRMGTALYGDKYMWITVRLVRIFEIFGSVYGPSMSTRIVKVLPAWAAGASWGEALLTRLNNTAINPTKITMDALSIAPYVGGSVGAAIGNIVGRQFTITMDEVLDMVRDSLYTEVQPWVQSNALVAKKYGLELVAYEGGPGLVAPIWYTGPAYANLTALLTGANAHPRIKDLVKQMFYIWYSNGGALFNYFADIGGWSIYGSWGMIQSMTEDLNSSPKYQAFKEVLNIQNGVVPSTSTSGAASASTTTARPTSATAAGPTAGTTSTAAVPSTTGSTTSSKGTTSTGTVTSTAASSASGMPQSTTSEPIDSSVASGVQYAYGLAVLFIVMIL